jgi:hypothetical protein
MLNRGGLMDRFEWIALSSIAMPVVTIVISSPVLLKVLRCFNPYWLLHCIRIYPGIEEFCLNFSKVHQFFLVSHLTYTFDINTRHLIGIFTLKLSKVLVKN